MPITESERMAIDPPVRVALVRLAPLVRDVLQTLIDGAGDMRVTTIVEQGEGSRFDREGSHYRKFLTIRTELESLCAGPGFEPAWPVVDNPVLRKPPLPGSAARPLVSPRAA